MRFERICILRGRRGQERGQIDIHSWTCCDKIDEAISHFTTDPNLLTIQLLGAPRFELDGAVLPPPRVLKGIWLLAILALKRGEEVDRDWLAGILWPDSEDPLGTLRRTLTDVRKSLGPMGHVVEPCQTRNLRLAVEQCRVDVLEFREAMGRGDLESLEAALAFYREDLLPTCDLDWMAHERSLLQEELGAAVSQAAELHRQAGNFKRAAELLRRGIEANVYRESMYQELMQTLADGGDVAEAILTFRSLRRILRRDLRAEPSAESTAVYRRILSQVRGNFPAEPVKLSTPLPKVLNLPTPLTHLIGREAELTQIAEALGQARLVTLFGMGGIGKTHLATEAARSVQGRYEQGVLFIELRATVDGTRIAPTLLSALDVRDDGQVSPTGQLISALRDAELLLVLDNCEHLLDACAEIARSILRECPHVQILATSRQALGLVGESLLAVPPLRSPSSEGLASGALKADPVQWPAVALFAERAKAAMPGFAVTEQNFAQVAQLCAGLEGIPLALELAAARLRALSIEQIRAKMDDRYVLLSQDRRGALPHQQTLRKMMEWSDELLSPPERMLFYRQSIFSQGWTLEATEAVCADADGSIQGEPILDLLTQLIDKSLVQSEPGPGDERRYRMLETVKEYSAERLSASGEVERMRQAHAAYFFKAIESVYTVRQQAGEKGYLAFAEVEYPNLRSALETYFKDPEQGSSGQQFAGYLQDFWWIRGLLREGVDMLTAALDNPGGQGPTLERAFAQAGLGVLYFLQGKGIPALEHLEKSLAIRKSLGDDRGAAIALLNLGSVHRDLKDFGRARECLEESLTAFRLLDRPWNVAGALTNLGSVAVHQGELDYAEVCYTEAVAIRRASGDLRGVSYSLCGLGEVWMLRNLDEQALVYFDEALAIQRDFNDKGNLTITLLDAGRAHRKLSNYPAALNALQESLEICCETGDTVGSTALLELAILMADQGDYRSSGKLLGACDGSLLSDPGGLTGLDRDARVALEHRLRSESVELFNPDHAEGLRWSTQEALAWLGTLSRRG